MSNLEADQQRVKKNLLKIAVYLQGLDDQLSSDESKFLRMARLCLRRVASQMSSEPPKSI